MFSAASDPGRKQLLLFALHVVMLLVAFALPWPWLPDVYVTAFDATANLAAVPINAATPVHLRFIPPREIVAKGSWKGELDVSHTTTGEHVRTHLDVRGFSYRPLATYIALALALPSLGRRRSRALAVLVGGGVLTVIVGFVLAALPVLSRLGRSGAFGFETRRIVAMAYEALATPEMVYAIPLILFWFVVRGL